MHGRYRAPVTEIWTVLERRALTRPADPVITYVGADGSRTELSARTLANNVAKAANALRDDALHDPGARVAMHLPWHWQRSVWALAAWAVDLTIVPDGDPSDCDLVIADPQRAGALTGSAEVWVVSLHPFGLPNATVPGGTLDAATIARAMPDHFRPFGPAHHPALEALSQGALLEQADARQVPPRFIVAGTPADPIDAWLLPTLIPLAGDAAIVMCDASCDVAAIAAQEGAVLLT